MFLMVAIFSLLLIWLVVSEVRMKRRRKRLNHQFDIVGYDGQGAPIYRFQEGEKL
jgi:hypothetical protein